MSEPDKIQYKEVAFSIATSPLSSIKKIEITNHSPTSPISPQTPNETDKLNEEQEREEEQEKDNDKICSNCNIL